MARSPVAPRQAAVPGLLEQLMVLPPSVRIVAGAVMLVLGVVAVAMHVSIWSLALYALAMALGIPLVWHGLADRARRRREAAERARAAAELPELRTAIAAAVAANHGVRRVLRQRGYTSDKVMRWIVLECDVVLAKDDMQP